MILSGIPVLLSFPFVFRFCEITDNPIFSPSSYVVALVVTLIAIWSITGVVMLMARRANS
jgi:hypothetical protein